MENFIDRVGASGGGALEPVPCEVYEALDVLERYCRERVIACEPHAVDVILTLRRMVTSAGAVTGLSIAGAIGSTNEAIDPAELGIDPGHAGASGTSDSTGRVRGIPTP